LETTRRFPKELATCRTERDISTANLRLIEEREKRKNKKNKKAKDRDRSTTRCLDRPAVMAGFAVLVNGRFSDVHRGAEVETPDYLCDRLLRPADVRARGFFDPKRVEHCAKAAHECSSATRHISSGRGGNGQ
jgi:hypothetical protein